MITVYIVEAASRLGEQSETKQRLLIEEENFMAEKFYHITIKLVPDTETRLNETIIDQSFFLKAAYRLDASRIVGPLDPNIKKDKSLGQLWADVKPTAEGYVLEIATELSYYLPNLNNQCEFVLKAGGVDYFICNRMVRAFRGEGYPKINDLNYLLMHQLAIPSLKGSDAEGLHPIPIKTFISRKFACKTETAEEAIYNNFIAWREELIRGVSILVDAFRTADPQKSKHLLPHSAISSFPVFWVLISGADGKLGCEQFAGEVGLAALRPLQSYDKKSVDRINDVLNEKVSISPYEASLSLATTFSHYGYYSLALIHLCTACETLLSTKLRQQLQSRGMSKNHLDKYFDDVTFSHLLNLHLPNLCDLAGLNNYQDILGKLNWARQRRNEIVHLGEATGEINSKLISEAIDAATALFEFLSKNTLKSRGFE